MPAEAGVQTWQVIGWAVALGGTAASLIWNYINQSKTTNLGRQIRQEQHELENWSRIRNKLEERSEAFLEAITAVEAQLPALPADKTHEQFFKILNITLVNCEEALAAVIKEARVSPDCKALMPSTFGRGRMHDQESSYDLLLAEMDKLIDAGSDEGRRIASIKVIKSMAREMQEEVVDFIRRQDALLRPTV